jgi:prepilin-type processing-associated H-X9-DG protein
LDNEEIVSKVTKNEWLHCPAISNRQDDKFGYAFNAELSARPMNGKPLKEMPNAATTPLLYDSTNLAKNAQDKTTSLPRPGRHSGRNNILYCDGHVAAVEPR